jgi:hypothetical protein
LRITGQMVVHDDTMQGSNTWIATFSRLFTPLPPGLTIVRRCPADRMLMMTRQDRHHDRAEVDQILNRLPIGSPRGIGLSGFYTQPNGGRYPPRSRGQLLPRVVRGYLYRRLLKHALRALQATSREEIEKPPSVR